MLHRATSAVLLLAAGLVGAGAGASASASAAASPGPCEAGGPPAVVEGTAAAADAKTYVELPVQVGEGVTRLEVTYDWTGDGVIDLGLWDPSGRFRGWSGSRGGRVSHGQEPVFIQPDVAARGYDPGPVDAGAWTVDLGLATIAPEGTTYTVTVTCTAPAVGPAFVGDHVDPDQVLDPQPGEFLADFHVHGFESNASAPTWDQVVQTYDDAGFDVVFATDYVTDAHWGLLGPVQRAHPGVLVVPGREIVTYFGHAMALGETPDELDYRHGFDDVTLRGIEDATVADGALFQVNHPTTFPEAQYADLCRGCEFQLGDEIDWNEVTTYEVLNTSVVNGGDPTKENPFVQTAIDSWEQLLLEGHRLTAVSGSDSKGVENTAEERERAGYGSSGTAILADQLSRAAVFDALRAGRAYIRTRGPRSPQLVVTLRTAAGEEATFGGVVGADEATLHVEVRGGLGHTVVVSVDGEPVGQPVAVDADPFTYETPVHRSEGSGPLGTFVRVDTVDPGGIRSTIGNPLFLAPAGEAPTATSAPATTAPATAAPAAGGGTGGGTAVFVVVLAVLVLGAGLAVAVTRRRRM